MPANVAMKMASMSDPCICAQGSIGFAALAMTGHIAAAIGITLLLQHWRQARRRHQTTRSHATATPTDDQNPINPAAASADSACLSASGSVRAQALAHEMKMPLSSINACAEMLAESGLSDQEQAELRDIIQQQVCRLTRMIDATLVQSVEVKWPLFERRPCRMDNIVADVIRAMRPMAIEKHIALSYEIAKEPLEVWGHADLLHQAVANLVSNALKYSTSGSTVRVHCYQETNREVLVDVHDEGVGIPATSLQSVFRSFYRVRQHRHLAKGMGLGLSVVRQIIEGVHRGQLALQSKPGRGSTFRICLPLREANRKVDHSLRTPESIPS